MHSERLLVGKWFINNGLGLIEMRYINLRFTYLLFTYLLIGGSSVLHCSVCDIQRMMKMIP